MNIKEAAEGIFMVTRFFGTGRSRSSVNSFVLTGEQGLVFDPGYGSWRRPHPLVRAVRRIQAGLPEGTGALTRAMASHSHWDHFSGLSALQDQLGLEILATGRQADVMTSRRAFRKALKTGPEGLGTGWRRIQDALVAEAFITLARVCMVKGPVTVIPERFALTVGDRTWEVIPAPGHCDDDVVLFCRQTGILLGGDLVLRTINTWLGPPRSDLGTYLQSLDMLAALPGLSLILPAHGSPVIDPVPRIRAVIRRRRQKAEDLRRLLAASGTGGMTVEQILAEIDPKGGRIQRHLSRGVLEASLDYLVREGLAERLPDGRSLRYRSL